MTATQNTAAQQSAVISPQFTSYPRPVEVEEEAADADNSDDSRGSRGKERPALERREASARAEAASGEKHPRDGVVEPMLHPLEATSTVG